MQNRLKLGLLFVIVGPVASVKADLATWTQWRGPERNCYVTGKSSWPVSLSKTNFQKRWQLQCGPSYSGPIVSETAIFITETRNRRTEVVRALDRKTGRELWTAEWEGAISVPFFARANGSWIRATPIFDGHNLYVAGIRDVLVCLDGKTGKEQWRLDFVKKLNSRLPSFGYVSSPLIDGEFLYVQAGGGVACVKKQSGQIVWQTLKDGGGTFGSAFSSPVIATIHGIKQLVVQTRTTLAGVDLKTGKVFWSVKIPAFRGMNILTPTVIDNQIFTSSYGGKSLLLEIVKSEDENWSVREKWTAKLQGYMSSPVVIGGHIYLHLRNQRFACLKIASGKICWISQPFGKYWSMAVQGKQILALDQRGELLLIEANPKQFQLKNRLKISDESTWAHIAVCGNEVFVRSLNGLMVFRWNARKKSDRNFETSDRIERERDVSIRYFNGVKATLRK
ncbi:MAG: PQQ-like beta-propeller repeat protein [Planctomycetaceae bacterium]